MVEQNGTNRQHPSGLRRQDGDRNWETDPSAEREEETRRAVLIVDDDREIRWALSDLLQDEGYHTYEAGDGGECLAFLERSPEPVVVLLDLMMPGMDGLTVCRRLEHDPALLRDHTVIVMSARTRIQMADCPVASATISKPFDLDKLLLAVERLAANRPGHLESRSAERESGTAETS